MITYRDVRRQERVRDRLDRLRALCRQGSDIGLLVELGEFEQGLLDAAGPQADDWGRLAQRCRQATTAAARAYLAMPGGERGQPEPGDILQALHAVEVSTLPERMTVHAPEGFVHYGVDPAAYAAAAWRYRADAGEARARQALVVGVRSIGTTLSAVVAAVLGAARSATVRPRGEVGRRRVAAAAPLVALVAGAARSDADALIVDEGPGATGETFDAVAWWLRSLGWRDERMVLFPSRDWGMPLAPETRRAWFAAARKYAPAEPDGRPGRLAAELGLVRLEDLSFGRWRPAVHGVAGAPANPGHERTKYRAWDAAGRPYLIRYAGLGSWGAAAVARARQLYAAGAGPAVAQYAAGYLVREWVAGPATSRAVAKRDRRFLTALNQYLRARAPLFLTSQMAEVGPIVAALRENAEEALGPRVPGLPEAIGRLERLPARPAVIADARLQPWEWVRAPSGYVKVDATDHGDGLRLPGPTDLAWDLAGAAVEYDLADGVLAEMVQQVAAASRGQDTVAGLAAAVAAYRPPYAACCLGEAALASWEAPTGADKRRQEGEVARYRAALRAELDRM